LAFAQDSVAARFRQGRNVLVLKVVNGNPPGGVALGVRASQDVQFRTD
jgi:hypothetical protein